MRSRSVPLLFVDFGEDDGELCNEPSVSGRVKSSSGISPSLILNGEYARQLATEVQRTTAARWHDSVTHDCLWISAFRRGYERYAKTSGYEKSFVPLISRVDRNEAYGPTIENTGRGSEYRSSALVQAWSGIEERRPFRNQVGV